MILRVAVGCFVAALMLLGVWIWRPAVDRPQIVQIIERACVPPESSPSNNSNDDGMIWISGGSFTMGADETYADEGPARSVRVNGFWIDPHEVTNAQFATFVEATGYTTLAERKPTAADFPNAPPELLKPGSAVFQLPDQLSSQDILQWWLFVPGADWRHPAGPESTLEGLEDYPVVHVAFEDAVAYATWAGRDLPTEAQWEYAARGGTSSDYPWGDQLAPGGAHMANTWQGTFPIQNKAQDGYAGRAPVQCFPANSFGLHDMIGNVWEWTADRYAPSHDPAATDNPKGPPAGASYDPSNPGLPVRVIKGGSFLCAPNYCMRYRPAARHAQDTGLGTDHIGFRTVLNEPGPGAE